MNHIFKLLIVLLLTPFINSFGQTILTIPVNLQNTYYKGTRTVQGPPGKNYWQNDATYTIKINFNPKNLTLAGTVAIDYINNSPDTLKQIDFKLYPNIFKNGAIRNMRVEPADITNGVQIQKLSIDHQNQDAQQWTTEGTNMTLKIPGLIPKKSIHLDITYSYTINKTSHIRTGQVDPGAFFIAYFFPHITVYDDIDGWNEYNYLGTQEFYNDYSHFNAEITVPGNYQVWATGNLKNADEVYRTKYVKLIGDATKNDSITDIITQTDVKDGNITKNRISNTWKFEADSVTDIAFAISNHYLWKSTSLVVDPKTNRRTRVDAVFNPDHKGYYQVINYARKTVEAMSYKFPEWPYPFAHETVFDGLDQMEYPMMVNDAPYDKIDEDIELTDHEIFHSMFPFYMGVNETKYAWMDEGWATMGEWVISPVIDSTINDLYAVNAYENNAGREEDTPISTLSTQLEGIAYMTNSYPKPALGYLYVKDMLGNPLFTKALHYYITQWHGKHPMPFDFFNCMNTGSGLNLNWFWKNWFFDPGVPDQAISKVTHLINSYIVTITNIGTKFIPVDLTIFYTDGSTQLMHQSIACWKNGNKTIILKFTAAKPVKKLVLGTGYDPDVNKADNVWVATPS